MKFHEVPHSGVKVDRGMTHDGIGEYLSDIVEVERDRDKPEGQTSDIVEILRERKVDVVINYLPVGSEEATKWYVEQVLAAGCGFVNCIPVFIANFVLMDYGSGAVFGCPAHDQRDLDFAHKYKLEIIPVIMNDEIQFLMPYKIDIN